MRVFWWTEFDRATMMMPVLWTAELESTEYPTSSYDQANDIRTWLAEGAREITSDTARVLGYPV